MLKIKDNVTYQKLNKIGFRKDYFNETYDYEIDADITISINENDKRLTTFVESGYEIRELDSDDYTTMEQLEHWLPEMVNLVQKVEV